MAQHLHIDTLPAHIGSEWSADERAHIIRAIRDSLLEDIGDGDVSSLATVSNESVSVGRFLAKQAGIISGIHVVEAVFYAVDPDVTIAWSVADGATVTSFQHFGTVRGRTLSLLTAERTALNFIQRMSAIATSTAAMQAAAYSSGSKSRILDTRKTVPGLRYIDKIAVRHGGGTNHRIGLFDMVMLKDNHIDAAGGIANAVTRVREYLNANGRKNIPIEVETRNINEVNTALQVSYQATPYVTRIMLDNMVKLIPQQNGAVVADCQLLSEAMQVITTYTQAHPHHHIETEASGNVTLVSVKQIAATNVTYISCGALTHSVTALDISFKIKSEVTNNNNNGHTTST